MGTFEPQLSLPDSAPTFWFFFSAFSVGGVSQEEHWGWGSSQRITAGREGQRSKDVRKHHLAQRAIEMPGRDLEKAKQRQAGVQAVTIQNGSKWSDRVQGERFPSWCACWGQGSISPSHL